MSGLDEYLEPGTDEQGTDGWDANETNWEDSNEPNDWKMRRPCKFFLNYGSCRKGIDCEYSHEKDDGFSWHNAEANDSQAWCQDELAESGSKDAEENKSTWNWDTENQNDMSPTDDDDGNRESNKSADNGWNGNGGQGGTDQWDETRGGGGNDQRDSSGWDATAGGNSETSRKSNRQIISQPSDGRRTVCKHYLRGSCNRPVCRYSHETDDTALHDWNKNDWVTRNPLPSKDEWAGKDEHDNWWGNETKDTATRANEWDAPSTTSRQQDRQGDRPDHGVCWAYLRGACYRASCRFAHESAGNQRDGDSGNTNDQAKTWDSSAYTWDTRPSESNADSRHQTNYGPSHTSSGRRQEACLYFGQGYCQRGDSCPQLHVQSDEIMNSENQEVSVSIFHDTVH